MQFAVDTREGDNVTSNCLFSYIVSIKIKNRRRGRIFKKGYLIYSYKICNETTLPIFYSNNIAQLHYCMNLPLRSE